MAGEYLAQVQALIAERMKENPEEMKRRLKEIERAKKEAKKAKKAPKAPPKPLIDPQLTQELIVQLNEGSDCNLEFMKDLIKRGADIKVEGDWGTTLHQACWKGDLELIELCLQNGVDPHLRSMIGSKTALYYAENGYAFDLFSEIKEIFRKYGAIK
jgi:hypothetical protein